MLESCLDCVRKHIGAAVGLMNEAHLGYPPHRWLAVGELYLAEEESLCDYPELAVKIREQRLVVMKSHAESRKAKLFPLILMACSLAGESEDLVFDPSNSKTIDTSILNSNGHHQGTGTTTNPYRLFPRSKVTASPPKKNHWKSSPISSKEQSNGD